MRADYSFEAQEERDTWHASVTLEDLEFVGEGKTKAEAYADLEVMLRAAIKRGDVAEKLLYRLRSGEAEGMDA